MGNHAQTRVLRRPAEWRRNLASAASLLAWLAITSVLASQALSRVWRDDAASVDSLDAAVTFGALLAQTFRLHLGLALAGALAVLVPAMMALSPKAVRRPIAMACCATAAFALTLGPRMLQHSPIGPERADSSTAGNPTDTFAVYSANLFVGAADAPRVARQILALEPAPNVVCLQEYTPEMAARIKPLLSNAYPYRVEYLHRGAWGQAIYSRTPFEGVDDQGSPETAAGWSIPQLGVTLRNAAGARIKLWNVHLMSPSGLDRVAQQRRQIAALGDLLEEAVRSEEYDAVIAAGDFNAPSHTTHLREILRAGMREVQTGVGRGRIGAWPRKSEFRWFPNIRLDHVFHSDGAVRVRSGVLDDTGSDHRPVYAVFEITRPTH